jgi:hypothetical protein
MADEEIYWKVINETPDKQLRLVVNEFRGVEYLHLREYYMDFDEVWMPSNKGVSMPLTFENSKELFAGLLEILSLAESKELIVEHFKELIENTYD